MMNRPVPTEDIDRRFRHHPPKDDDTVDRHVEIRETMRDAANTVNAMVPDGREKSLAITKLEEAMMWANAGIAREGN